jgi:hypothetical protein
MWGFSLAWDTGSTTAPGESVSSRSNQMTEQNGVEEEEEETTTTEKPEHNWQSAYWALVRSQYADAASDTYGGAYRGTRPTPHGGSQTVRPTETLGTLDLCWCGEPKGHDWPGKRIGAKHPKEGTMNTQVATTLDRRDLRAYHSRLQDFILSVIGEEGVRFRVGKNAVILYPPDGSAPMSVYARNTDRQVRSLQKWYVDHVYQEPETKGKKPVQEANVEALAEALNDPAEHPRPPVAPERSVTKEKRPPRPSPRQKTKAEAEAAATAGGEWVPYEMYDGEVSPLIQMNGKGGYRCTGEGCVGTEHENLQTRSSIGGHIRMWHTDRSDLHSPETRAIALETRHENQRQKATAQAIELLLPLAPEGSFVPVAEVAKIKKENDLLRTEVTNLKQIVKNLKQEPVVDVEALTKRAEEAEAKLALAREAMGL